MYLWVFSIYLIFIQMFLANILQKQQKKQQNQPLNSHINIADILKHTYKAVPIGKSPIQQLQIQTTSQQDYKQLKYILTQILQYPCTDLAKIHRDSNKIGTLDLHQNAEILTKINIYADQKQTSFVHCMCCGFMLQREEISLTEKIVSIDNLGVSTFLYFQTLKSLGIMLMIQFLAYGIFSLVTNIIASESFTSAQSIPQNLNFLVISLASKQLNQTQTNETYYSVQCWLGLATVVIWCFVLLVIKYFEKRQQIMIQSQTLSAADYSVMIKGIPSKITKQQLQRHLNKYYQELRQDQKPKQIDKTFIIKKFNLVVPFYVTEQTFKDQQLKKLLRQQQQKRDEFIKWIIHRKSHSQFPVQSSKERKRYFNEFKSLKRKVEKKHKSVINKVIREYKDKQEQAEGQLQTIAFVTLSSNHAKQLICRLNDDSILNKLRQFLLNKSNQQFEMEYRGKLIQPQITAAPEPEDVIWTNLGQKTSETVFLTLVILAGSFGIIYLLSTEQTKNVDSYFISFLLSIAIAVINVIIQQVIMLLTSLQRQSTQTKHQTSLAIKSVFAQLVNTIVTPFVVNYFIENKNLYRSNGLAYDLFLLGLTNAFLMPLLKVFDPLYFLTRIVALWYSRPQNKLKITQQALNAKFQLIPFQIGYEYIYLVNLYLFICYFISLQPILCIFGIVGFLCMFWAQKYSLLNRMRRPFPGNDFVNTTMYQLIYLGPLFFSLGNLTWSNLLADGFPKSALLPNLISIGFSVLVLFLPYKTVFILLFDGVFPDQMKFQDNRVYLPSQYDRLNPSTSKQAISEYVQYIKQVRDQVKQTTEQQFIRIQQIFFAQSQTGRKKPNSILSLLGHYSKLAQLVEDQPDTPTHTQKSSLSQKLDFEDPNQDQIKQRSKQAVDIRNPYSILKTLHVSNHKVVNFVQNWVQVSSKQLQQSRDQLLNSEPKNLTYDLLANLMMDNKIKSQKLASVNVSNENQQTLTKFGLDHTSLINIFNPHLVKEIHKNKDNSIHNHSLSHSTSKNRPNLAVIKIEQEHDETNGHPQLNTDKDRQST